MRLKSVPVRQGVVWAREGFRAFTRRPLAFTTLFLSVMFGVGMVRIFPLLMLAISPLIPLISLGFMIATRIVLEGGTPTPHVFVAPLRVDRQRTIAMLRLGLVYTVSIFAIVWFSSLIDGNIPGNLVEALPAAASAPDAASSPAMTVVMQTPSASLWVQLILAALLAIPFWHAPALIHWDNQSCAQSLFSSTLACWRNRGAFVAYCLVWFGLVAIISLLGSMLLTLFGDPAPLIIATIPVTLFFGTIYFASLYFTFADSFIANDAETVIDA